MVSIVWSMYLSLSTVGTDEFKLQKLVGNVTHLNEVLTMSARMSAATGDPEWEQRYRAIEPELDEAITSIALLAREEYEKTYAAHTKLAYLKLIEREGLALSLVKSGRKQEASELLFSPEYDRQQTLYSEGLSAMTSAVERRVAEEIRGFRKRIWQIGFLGLVNLSVLLMAWLGVWLVMKGHLARRKQAEDALAREKEQLSVTLRSIDEGVITTSPTGRVVMMNRTAEQLTGWTQKEALGKKIEDVFHAFDDEGRQKRADPLVEGLKRLPTPRPETQAVLVVVGGARRLIGWTSAPINDPQSNIIGVVIAFRDITERQALQAERVKGEKLESLGILAGGIAHDFNNILTAVAGNISLAKLDVPPENEAFHRLTEAENAAMRASHLTHQLLTFSKGGLPIRRIASVRELLTEWAVFALRGSNVRCEFDIEPDLWPAEIDTGQISQVVSNLVINAEQAMPDGGTLHVCAANHTLRGDASPGLRPGHYIKITVRDEGVGIPPEHLKKVFDPYFTTKEKGSGLGLATAHSAITRHDGRITVESRVSEGTTFTIFLPASPLGRPDKIAVVEPPLNGAGRILLMDDDDAVRELAAEMLKFLGYEVSTASEGTQAVRLYDNSREEGRPFDAVIMDLTIPGGMGGAEAITILRRLDPQIRAIVSSGYSNDPIMANYRDYGFSGVLCKPFSAESMSDVLRQVINLQETGCSRSEN
jgi:PAS domain S-box-containing protein